MRHFVPAIYVCARCGVEHHGDKAALPTGWHLCYGIKGEVTQCGDCCDAVDLEIDGYAFDMLLERPTPGMAIGVIAAAFAGALVRASDLPAREARQ